MPQQSTRSLRRNQAGASMLEYSLLLGLIMLVVIASVAILGQESSESFSRVGAGFPAGNN